MARQGYACQRGSRKKLSEGIKSPAGLFIARNPYRALFLPLLAEGVSLTRLLLMKAHPRSSRLCFPRRGFAAAFSIRHDDRSNRPLFTQASVLFTLFPSRQLLRIMNASYRCHNFFVNRPGSSRTKINQFIRTYICLSGVHKFRIEFLPILTVDYS